MRALTLLPRLPFATPKQDRALGQTDSWVPRTAHPAMRRVGNSRVQARASLVSLHSLMRQANAPQLTSVPQPAGWTAAQTEAVELVPPTAESRWWTARSALRAPRNLTHAETQRGWCQNLDLLASSSPLMLRRDRQALRGDLAKRPHHSGSSLSLSPIDPGSDAPRTPFAASTHPAH